MEALTVQRFQFSSRIDLRKFEDKNPCGSLRFTQRTKQVVSLAQLQPEKRKNHQQRSVSSGVSCSNKNSPALLEIQSLHSPFDKELILQRKAEEIKPYLNERSLYLVGMMGSGKTTVGKLMAKALGYTFLDCDSSIENSMNGTSIAEIFQHFGENFFREKETEALKKLSLLPKLVVSTGGGAVIKPVNWKYMNKGISIWLDVPIEALAHRIAAVGTDSRPLLHDESGDAYTVAFDRLSMIWDSRGERYANASVKVCLKNLAAKFRYRNVSDLTPTEIAVEAFEQVKSSLVKEDSNDSLGDF